MERYIPISYLNDFLYCPESNYLHGIYQDFDHSLYQSHFQVNGKIHHTNVDHANYSTSSNILQGTSVYSSKYKLFGKIDLFEIDEGRLIERKARISKVFLGHKYQLYAQMFGLNEAGFEVKTLAVHLNIILLEIETIYKPKFTLADSIIVVPITTADESRIRRYGYSVQEQKDLLWLE